jgi:hypothetical protein
MPGSRTGCDIAVETNDGVLDSRVDGNARDER